MTDADNQIPSPRRATALRVAVVLVALALVTLAICAARLLIGNSIGWPSQASILEARLDRLWLGLIVGSGLAVSGVVLQSLLRNPLASPYILGISSGAGLGVMVALAGCVSWLGPGSHHLAALAGALLTMLIVYGLSQKRGRIDPIGLLLVGVIVNAINGAGIMFIQYTVPHGVRGDLATWLMGYLNDGAARSIVMPAAFVTVAGTVVAIGLGRAMDVASVSDVEAHSVGLNLPRLRLILFAVAGVLTAGAVLLAGPIGFVGLICPHLVRLLIGPSHRPLLIGSALAGASLIVGADTAIKLIDVYVLHSGLMPIGVLTAVIGGPIFIWLLRAELGRGAAT